MNTAKTAIIAIVTIAIGAFVALQVKSYMDRKAREAEAKRLTNAAAAQQAGAAADEVANNE